MSTTAMGLLFYIQQADKMRERGFHAHYVTNFHAKAFALASFLLTNEA